MWPIPPPAGSVEFVLSCCISNIRDPQRKEMFASAGPRLDTSERQFTDAARNNTLHLFPTSTSVGDIQGSEMVWLYDAKLAGAKSPGRYIYDEIKMAAPYGRCPLCGRGTVSSLDHHLPKSAYPDLAITPLNLVPCCQDCNKAKLNAVPLTADQETLHPYFDDLEEETWLQARIEESFPAAVVFFVSAPPSWSLTLGSRAINHFKVFHLGRIYASNAAEELSNLRGTLTELRRRLGAEGVKDHLRSLIESYRANRRNSWQSALYSAMAKSEWFCAGGFALDG